MPELVPLSLAGPPALWSAATLRGDRLRPLHDAVQRGRRVAPLHTPARPNLRLAFITSDPGRG